MSLPGVDILSTEMSDSRSVSSISAVSWLVHARFGRVPCDEDLVSEVDFERVFLEGDFERDLTDGDFVRAFFRGLADVDLATLLGFTGAFFADGDFVILVTDRDLAILVTDGEFTGEVADILGFFEGEFGLVSELSVVYLSASNCSVFFALLIRIFCCLSALFAKSKR